MSDNYNDDNNGKYNYNDNVNGKYLVQPKDNVNNFPVSQVLL